MNDENIKNKTLQIFEIYDGNGRTRPNAFRVHELLGLNLRKRRFDEFVNAYKQYNGGYF